MKSEAKKIGIKALVFKSILKADTKGLTNIETFNAEFGFRAESTPGTLGLLEKAWLEAKSRSAGKC